MSKSKPFYLHLFPAFLFMTLVVIVVLYFSTSRQFKSFYEQQTRQELLGKAKMFSVSLKQALQNGGNVDSLTDIVGQQTATRFTVISPTGIVIGDSDEDPQNLPNHSKRPEVIQAKNEKVGSSIRYSETVNMEQMYVAILDDSLVIRTSIPLTLYASEMSRYTGGVAVAVGAAIVSAILLSLLLTWIFSRHIDDLKERAKLLSEGKFTPSPTRSSISEIAELSEIMQNSAETLGKRFRSISRQKERLRGVLAGMVEGVIAFDSEEKVFLLNDAARKMLNIEKENPKGCMIHELIRNVPFQQIVNELLSNQAETSSVISVPTDGDPRILNMNCRILENSKSFLIVMHDITDLKRLENLRRDFAGNVSHELRTPLTSIKGFVETLVDGAINDPDDASHFLGIINRQVDRLNQLIEDLLMIARLEKEEETGAIDMVVQEVRPICETAISNCRERAEKKDIKILFRTEDDLLKGNVVPSLVEQALNNLIDNAIKYSNFGTVIAVETKMQGSFLAICVSDEGTGIPKQHLSRLFERFYRVDKARSSAMGGTGLGLAIVKHIAGVHNGSVSVESVMGKGSTFTILLPKIDC